MRPFEILTPILIAGYLVFPALGIRRPPILIALPILLIITIILHLAVEHYRWQMIPLYALSALVVFLFLRGYFVAYASIPTSFARMGGIVLLIATFIASALPFLLSVPQIPKPSGKFAVGTSTFVLVDESRKDNYSDNSNDPRKFMIQVWYPAAPEKTSQRAPWIPNAEIVAPAIAVDSGLPSFFFDQLSLAKSHVYLNPPVAKPESGLYPVILFAPGWGSYRGQNSIEIEELASHGYVVIALEFTHINFVSVFPDGQIIPEKQRVLPADETNNEIYEPEARKVVNQWAEDMSFALDYITALNASDPRFKGKFDLERVGVFGHSTGGGATVEFCYRDPRCKAGLTLDAWMRPVSLDAISNGTKQPFFYMFSETWSSERNYELFDEYYSNLKNPAPVVVITGTAHNDFADLPLLSPLSSLLGFKGPIKSERMFKIMNTYLPAFFDYHLKNIPTNLFDGVSQEFPELIWR